MSSPSNVVVVITHVQMDKEEFCQLAAECYKQWSPESHKEGNRLWHTDVVIDSFFCHAIRGDGYIEGPEGECFSFASTGNYFNVDDFLEAIEPFIRELVARLVYTSATIFSQHHDAGFMMYKLDGAALVNTVPNLELRAQRKFEANAMLSFDCDIRNIRTCDIKEPTQGPPEPMTPERAKNIEDLIKALEAGYGGTHLVEIPKGHVLSMEGLESATLEGVMGKVSFTYVGERRAHCKLCKEGYGLKCAFDADGLFMADNYQCGTMNTLRTLADGTFYKQPPVQLVWAGQQALVSIPISEDRFVVLAWYKHRGNTELAQVVEEKHIQCLTRDIAEEAIEFYKKQNLETF